MQKNYKFNEERGCYEFCTTNNCDLQDQLKEGDVAHKLCSGCIEEFEGVRPDNSELSSTSRIRKLRKQEVPHADSFISGVGTRTDILETGHSHKSGGKSRPDLDAIESGDV